MRSIFIILFFFIATNLAKGQAWEVGVWGGTSMYFGDLNPTFGFKDPGLAAGVFGRYNFNPRVSVKAGFNYADLGYADRLTSHPFQVARNLDFQSHTYEGALQIEFNFLKYIHGHEDHFFTPYFLAGGSVFRFNPRTKYEDEWVNLQPLGTEGQGKNEEYARTQMGIVYGGGFKFDLNIAWSINVEISSRILFTDYLDDVSTVYPDQDALRQLRGDLAVALYDRSYEVFESPIGEAGRQRGDSLGNDSFATIGISLVYNFTTVKCPGFK